MTDPVAAAALARNDRYLREFVEAFDVCPFARRCRETGALERRVVVAAPPVAAALAPALGELSSPPFAHVEVALLLFPGFSGDFPSFERFAAQVREVAARVDPPFAYYLVAFHPDAPEDDAGPHRLVPFLRRSPDPTLQLVRASLLERIRGDDSEDTVWVDPTTLDLAAPPVPRKSVSTRIAETNHETVRRVGLEHLRRLLASFR